MSNGTPPERPHYKRIVLLGPGFVAIIAVLLAVLVEIGLLEGGHAGIAVFLATPFGLGFSLGYTWGVRSVASWFVITGALLTVLGGLAAAQLAGSFCTLIGLVMLGLPLLIGAFVGAAIRRAAWSPRSPLWSLLPICILPPSADWAEQEFSHPHSVHTVVTRGIIELSPESAWQRMMFYEDVGGEPPLILKLGFPTPLQGEGVTPKVHDQTRCVYDKGHLIKETLEVIENKKLSFKVLEQQGIEDRSIRLIDGQFEFDALANERTRIILTTRYEPLLSPRWYWVALENYTAHQLHNHVIQGMAKGDLFQLEGPLLVSQ